MANHETYIKNVQETYIKIYTISYNSTIKKTKWFKNGQRICTDILPKKIYKWLMNT